MAYTLQLRCFGAVLTDCLHAAIHQPAPKGITLPQDDPNADVSREGRTIWMCESPRVASGVCCVERPQMCIQIQEIEEGGNVHHATRESNDAAEKTPLLCSSREDPRSAFQEWSAPETAADNQDLSCTDNVNGSGWELSN